MKKVLVLGVIAFAFFGCESVPIEQAEAEYPKSGGKLIDAYTSEYPGYKWEVRRTATEEFVALTKDGKDYGKYRFRDGVTTQGATLNKDTEATLAKKGWKVVKSYRKGNTNYMLNLDHAAVYEKNDNYVTYFFDQYDKNRVKATLAIPKDVEAKKEGFYGAASKALRTTDEKLMLRLMNWERAEYKKPALSPYTALKPVTRGHSENMAKNNFFSHTDPEGRDPFDRMKAEGIRFSMAGENLSMGYPNVFAAHWGLMNSKGHRENIMQSGFKQADVGVAFRKDAPYFTINFRTP